MKIRHIMCGRNTQSEKPKKTGFTEIKTYSSSHKAAFC